MPIQSAPPDTSVYLIAGYVAFGLIFAIYLLSLVVRRRNLEQDLKMLEGLRPEGQDPPRKGPIVKTGARPRAARPSARRSKANRKKVTSKR